MPPLHNPLDPPDLERIDFAFRADAVADHHWRTQSPEYMQWRLSYEDNYGDNDDGAYGTPFYLHWQAYVRENPPELRGEIAREP